MARSTHPEAPTLDRAYPVGIGCLVSKPHTQEEQSPAPSYQAQKSVILYAPFPHLAPSF